MEHGIGLILFQLLETVMLVKTEMVKQKGLQRQRLVGSAVAGFNHARTVTKASATGLDVRQDDYNKGI